MQILSLKMIGGYDGIEIVNAQTSGAGNRCLCIITVNSTISVINAEVCFPLDKLTTLL